MHYWIVCIKLNLRLSHGDCWQKYPEISHWNNKVTDMLGLLSDVMDVKPCTVWSLWMFSCEKIGYIGDTNWLKVCRGHVWNIYHCFMSGLCVDNEERCRRQHEVFFCMLVYLPKWMYAYMGMPYGHRTLSITMNFFRFVDNSPHCFTE